RRQASDCTPNFSFRPMLEYGRNSSSEESPLSYGELLHTNRKTTEEAYVLISQNIIRNDEGFFSLSLTTPNSAEKSTPNNGSWPLLVKGREHSASGLLPQPLATPRGVRQKYQTAWASIVYAVSCVVERARSDSSRDRGARGRTSGA